MRLAAHLPPLRHLSTLAYAVAVVSACADSPSEPANPEVIAPSFSTSATPVKNPDNGHYYLAVRARVDYPTAKAAAAAMSHLGVQGHLVTITSAEENEFIVKTFPEAVNPDPTSTGWSKYEGYWLGAERDGAGWKWVTNEAFSYGNWSSGEPNNAGGVENRIVFWPTWPGPTGLGKWNDRQHNAPVNGYVVEFKAPPAGGNVIMIDDFISGDTAWNLHGGGAPHYVLQTGLADVLGNVREHGHYNNNGGRVKNGALEWGVRLSKSPEYSVSYGSAVGLHAVHRSVPSPNGAAAVPLNINAVAANAELVIEVKNVVVDYVVIHLRTGSGEHFQASAALTVGEVRVPLSKFQSWWNGQFFDDADAADIDGIHFWQNGSYVQDGQGTKFGSFSIALGSSQPVDKTPPVITPVVDPAAPNGSNGWYVSDVKVSWKVTDAESKVTSLSGCDTVTVKADTKGQTFTCKATSAGGTASDSVTIKRDAGAPTISGSASTNAWTNADVQVTFTCGDATSGVESCGPNQTVSSEGADQSVSGSASDNAGNTASATVGDINIDKTAPVLSFSGNAGSYTVDQTVQIACSATDALSGIDTSSCLGASDHAYTFAIGTNTLNASATDNAGNSASASTSFTVQVTAGSLCTLVKRWVSQRGVANSLCQQLDNNAIRAFQNHVKAQSGKHVPADKAAILLRLSEAL